MSFTDIHLQHHRFTGASWGRWGEWSRMEKSITCQGTIPYFSRQKPSCACVGGPIFWDRSPWSADILLRIFSGFRA